jgi:cell division transport system permease protein
MVTTLFVIGGLIFFNVILTSTLSLLEAKVDISVYFKTDAPEEDILALRDSLTELNEVKSIEYISREQALEEFSRRHTNNALITQSLAELEENPLGAALNVKAKNPSQYESITRFLEGSSTILLDNKSLAFSSIIDKVNYRQNKLVIDRLSSILALSRQAGLGISLVLAFIAVLVTFNTIRLAIYTSRDEISVMRLVGASNQRVRGPFIVEGIVHGLFASLITVLIFYPLTFWLGPKAENFFGGLNIFDYYLAHWFSIFSILFLTGIGLGMLSAYVAVRRYLKV